MYLAPLPSPSHASSPVILLADSRHSRAVVAIPLPSPRPCLVRADFARLRRSARRFCSRFPSPSRSRSLCRQFVSITVSLSLSLARSLWRSAAASPSFLTGIPAVSFSSRSRRLSLPLWQSPLVPRREYLSSPASRRTCLCTVGPASPSLSLSFYIERVSVTFCISACIPSSFSSKRRFAISSFSPLSRPYRLAISAPSAKLNAWHLREK